MRKSNENLNIAYKYCEKTFSQNEIFEILRGNDDLLKPLAVLSVEKLTSKDEGELLLGHLTGVDGKIREAVSLKIAELWEEYKEYLFAPRLFVDALCDVNPNVCRNILELPPNQVLDQNLILERIENILDETDKICAKFRKNKERSHVLHVRTFNLYWCLEGLYAAFGGHFDERISKILLRAAESHDYTIREKVAKITARSDNPPIELLQKLENDVNFYVKRQVCGIL